MNENTDYALRIIAEYMGINILKKNDNYDPLKNSPWIYKSNEVIENLIIKEFIDFPISLERLKGYENFCKEAKNKLNEIVEKMNKITFTL